MSFKQIAFCFVNWLIAQKVDAELNVELSDEMWNAFMQTPEAIALTVDNIIADVVQKKPPRAKKSDIPKRKPLTAPVEPEADAIAPVAAEPVKRKYVRKSKEPAVVQEPAVEPIPAAEPAKRKYVRKSKPVEPVVAPVQEPVAPVQEPAKRKYVRKSKAPEPVVQEQVVQEPEPVVAAPEPVVQEPVVAAPEPVVQEPVVQEPVVAAPEPAKRKYVRKSKTAEPVVAEELIIPDQLPATVTKRKYNKKAKEVEEQTQVISPPQPTEEEENKIAELFAATPTPELNNELTIESYARPADNFASLTADLGAALDDVEDDDEPQEWTEYYVNDVRYYKNASGVWMDEWFNECACPIKEN